MIADLLSNKELNPILTELFIRGKNKHYSCFYYEILFFCTKYIRLNSGHYFIIKIPNKRVLQQISFNHS